MSKGYPSMTALLGLLAVAGYQNRDKIAELLQGLGQTGADHDAGRSPVPSVPERAASAGNAGGLGNLSGLLGGVGTAGVGGLIASGLGELVGHFTKGGQGGGQGEAAASWIAHGTNRDIPESDPERAIGSETLDHLTQQTGLGRAALLSRLSRELPSAVDRYSPDGRLPA